MATQYVARRRLRIAEEFDGWLTQVLNAYAAGTSARLDPSLESTSAATLLSREMW
jgi:hypothetical protein